MLPPFFPSIYLLFMQLLSFHSPLLSLSLTFMLRTSHDFCLPFAGKKVTMVDEHLKIFIIDLLSPETCEMIRTMTDNHVRKIHSEGNKVATWRTLYTYTKQDLPCGEVPHLTTITERIMRDVITCVGEIYENPREALKLRQRSWKEPHLCE